MKRFLKLSLILIISACSGGDNDDNDTNQENPFSGNGVYNETISYDGVSSGIWQGTVNQNNFIGDKFKATNQFIFRISFS